MQYLEDGTHNILLAVDFTQPTKRSFDAAVRMCRVFGAKLHVLHVNEEDELFGSSHSSEEVEKFVKDVIARRARWMESFEDTANELGIDADVILRDGRPADTILKVADEVDAGMIVMGTQGARGVSGLLTGSVAKRVLRRAERPVLVISREAGVAPAESGGSFEHVVYPTDFSDASRSGLYLAELFARRTECKLSLINVLRMPRLIPSMPGEQPIVIPQRVADELRVGLENQMAELVAGLDAEHVDSFIAINANASYGIVDAAKASGVDLILMPRHSQHSVSTYFTGRTAENLIKIAPVPVLLFDPRA